MLYSVVVNGGDQIKFFLLLLLLFLWEDELFHLARTSNTVLM